ncbi:hypothetical protein GCM10009798_34650 [Nocardioides panacihumi]|uniref:SAM-dependent methyltransferase n=1 Tax=Nocardioides panacihumi TaxID=400774 RepID=A0ABN2RL89_9ACTN
MALEFTEAPFDRAWLEPAAGSGAFTSAMVRRGLPTPLAFDIEPKAPGIHRADFLTTDLSDLHNAVCVTNPPFGRNHKLSIPFFNHAAAACDVIAFVVPRSWRKWSVQNRLDRRMHLAHDMDLDITYVDEGGESLTDSRALRTVFQVWVRRDEIRPEIVVEDRGYLTKTSPEEANVALTVRGYGCGTVSMAFERQKNSTRMYFRASDDVIQALHQIDFSPSYNNVAFVESLSYPEINHCLNEYFDGRDGLAEGA